MSRMRLTQQEADPIGGITAAPIVVIGAVLAFGASVVADLRALAARWARRSSPCSASCSSRSPVSRRPSRPHRPRAVLGGAAVARRRTRGGRGHRRVRLDDRRRPLHLRRLRSRRDRHAHPLAGAVLHLGVAPPRGHPLGGGAVDPRGRLGDDHRHHAAAQRADRGELGRGARHVGRRRRVLLRDRRRDARLAARGEPGGPAPRCGAARGHRPVGAAEPRVGARPRGAALPRRGHDRRPHLGRRRRPGPRARRGASTRAEGGHRVDLARRPRRDGADVARHPRHRRRPGRGRRRPRRRPAVGAHRTASRGSARGAVPRRSASRSTPSAAPAHRASSPSTAPRRRLGASSTASPRWLARSRCARKWP